MKQITTWYGAVLVILSSGACSSLDRATCHPTTPAYTAMCMELIVSVDKCPKHSDGRFRDETCPRLAECKAQVKELCK